MHYDIHVKRDRRRPVASVRAHTSIEKLGETMKDSIHAILQTVLPKGAWPTGAPYATYLNTPFRPNDVEVEIGMPMNRPIEQIELGPRSQVHVGELRRGAVAYTVHQGPYAEIGAAYAALYAWLREHGRNAEGPPREVYLVGPDETRDPGEFRTEIDLPIAPT